MQRKTRHILGVGIVLVLTLSVFGLFRSCGTTFDRFLFVTIINNGAFFSYVFFVILVGGLYFVFDRFFFWLLYDLVQGRFMPASRSGNGVANYFLTFQSKLDSLKKCTTIQIWTYENIDTAREFAAAKALDGQVYDDGRLWLEFLSNVAPAVGFLGTLVGLVNVLAELGSSGDLKTILSALGVALATSICGVVISLIFLSTSWLVALRSKSIENGLANLTFSTHDEKEVF